VHRTRTLIEERFALNMSYVLINIMPFVMLYSSRPAWGGRKDKTSYHQ